MAFRKSLIQSLGQNILVVGIGQPTRENGGQRATGGGALLEASHDGVFDVQAVLDKLDFRKCALLTDVDHARKPLGGRVGKNVVEIGCDALRPDGDCAAEFL